MLCDQTTPAMTTAEPAMTRAQEIGPDRRCGCERPRTSILGWLSAGSAKRTVGSGFQISRPNRPPKAPKPTCKIGCPYSTMGGRCWPRSLCTAMKMKPFNRPMRLP